MALNIISLLVVSQMPFRINSPALHFPSPCTQLFEIWEPGEHCGFYGHSQIAAQQLIVSLRLFYPKSVLLTSHLMVMNVGQQDINSGRK